MLSKLPDKEIVLPCGNWNGHTGREAAGSKSVHGGYGYGERNAGIESLSLLLQMTSVLYPDIFSYSLITTGTQKTEPKFLQTSSIFFYFYRFKNCPFFLPNYFITLFSCLASKSS